MTEIKTQAVVTKGDGNGLVDLAEEFARQLRGAAPRRLVPCIAFVVPKRMNIDGDTGGQTVTVGIVRIEALLEEDLKQAEVFVRRSLEKRLGMTTLPLDLEHDIEAAFTGIAFDVPEEEGEGGPDEGDGEPGGDGEPDGEDGEGEGPETGGEGSGYSDRDGWPSDR